MKLSMRDGDDLIRRLLKVFELRMDRGIRDQRLSILAVAIFVRAFF